MAYLLGIDLGSSSVKAALLDAATGECVASSFYPKDEQPIEAVQPGFAEQDPGMWYRNTCVALREVMQESGVAGTEVGAIGISYQMHGLVCVDSEGEPLRPAIIWCDSRAVPYGQKALDGIGRRRCLSHQLNSPGNFTAAKLAWVKDNEPDLYRRIRKIMLPGDWLAQRLTGRACTTVSGLSEGILWDFKDEAVSHLVMDWFGFDEALLPEVVPTFGVQGLLTAQAAADLGLRTGIPVAYRGGDQPNNAMSLNVLNPGEIAATAGTSGVVYGVTAEKKYDPKSRVNTFAHVNHTVAMPRLGVLLCINGTGILNAWVRRVLGIATYAAMNEEASRAPIGSDGLIVLPFGNGTERMLGNINLGARVSRLDLNRHGRSELCRAVQEGIVFSFRYGMDIMRSVGIELGTIRAGWANMFMSNVFCETLAGVSGAVIELYETDGALGAARGAGVGAGIYASMAEAFSSLARHSVTEPRSQDAYEAAYEHWKKQLERALK